LQTTINGIRWRLCFRHGISKPGQKTKKSRRGWTECTIESWTGGAWTQQSNGFTSCGPGDNFRKETGRQFALVRALRALKVPTAVKTSLITAYIKSGNREVRQQSDDLFFRGFRNLYEAALSETERRERLGVDH